MSPGGSLGHEQGQKGKSTHKGDSTSHQRGYQSQQNMIVHWSEVMNCAGFPLDLENLENQEK